MVSVSQVYDRDQALEAALEAVSDIEPDFENALLTCADAEAEYDIAYAKAYLAAEGTEKARAAEATIATEKYLKERNNARAIKEFIREKLRDRQANVSARQSLLAADVRTNRAFTG